MIVRALLALVLTAFMLAACTSRDESEQADGAVHGDVDDHAGEEVEKGPHHGRMLRDGSLALELAIAEDGIPPEFRVWLTQDGKPLSNASGQVEVVLTRLGGATDTHTFSPRADYLVGSAEVYEPHSFDVEVRARVGTQQARWSYSSYEGRTTIDANVAEQSGIRVAPAAAGVIRDEHEVQGLLTPIEGRHARVIARFPGPIRALNAGVGDAVRAGQTLATIESNVSLSNYTVSAPLTGTVLSRDAGVGELAGDSALFEIADLSKLWVDLHLFGSDAQHITPGLPVVVSRLSDGVSVATTLDRVLPATATASQSTVARATLENRDGRWRPGAAVRARVTVAEDAVPLVVPLSALQSFRDWDVVFIRIGDDYEVRPLELGRRDGVNVEVLAGLEAGDSVVIEQSYLVKADIEKSGASHDH
jgi:membrane fusion protein, heavy metal efflux system